MEDVMYDDEESEDTLYDEYARIMIELEADGDFEDALYLLGTPDWGLWDFKEKG